MAKQSAAYRLGEAMAKKAIDPLAPGAAGTGAVPPAVPYSTQTPASAVRPVTPSAGGGMAPAPVQPTNSAMTPNPTPTPAPTSTPAPAPAPKSPAAAIPPQPAYKPAPAPAPAAATGAAPTAPVAPRTSPLTASTRMPTPARTPMAPSARPMAAPGMQRSAAFIMGEQMAKEATSKEVQSTFKKIATVLGKRAGLTTADLVGMEKEAFPIAMLLGLLASGIGSYGVHQYGKGEGWWDSPALKGMKDRMKAISLARAQGVDPSRMGLVAPKKEKKRPWEEPGYTNYGSWGGGGSGNTAGLPKGYMKRERGLQNLSKHMGLGLRHARAFSDLSKMPVY